MEDIEIIVGGAAGQGTKQAGHLIADVLNRCGFKTFTREDYPSLIQGGHNFAHVRANRKPKRGLSEKVDFVLAMDENTYEYHADRVTEEFVYNSDRLDELGTGIPIETIAKEEGKEVMQNTALLGGFCKLIGVDFEVVEDVIETADDVPMPEENKKVAKKAYESVETKYELDFEDGEPDPVIDGNEALSLGALEAGMDTYFAYPMTPSTGILHFLSDLKQTYDLEVIQPENEIAVINEALGASYAGKRTMVGTSGGGFALMTEALSLAGISETPIVMVDSQRGAPASGVPTYNGQADLSFVLTAGHGDIPRFVFTPGDPEEAFELTNLAMNLTWKYQVPAIMLIDKEVSEGKVTFDRQLAEKAEKWEEKKGENSSDYCRYELTEDGVSPLQFPGGEAIVRNNSYEANEYGTTTEDPATVNKMQEKRMRKRELLKEEIQKREMVKTYGEGERVLITWGSSKMNLKEVALESGYKLVQILAFRPFPEKQLKEAVEGAEEIVVAEQNAQGQAANIIEDYVDVNRRLLKYDGRPFMKEEAKRKLNN